MLTIQELENIKKQKEKIVAVRHHRDSNAPNESGYKYQVLVCGGTGCTSSGCKNVVAALREEIAKHNLENDVKIVTTGCFGLCALGPIMIVYPEGSFYSSVQAETIPEIVEEHLVKVTL